MVFTTDEQWLFIHWLGFSKLLNISHEHCSICMCENHYTQSVIAKNGMSIKNEKRNVGQIYNLLKEYQREELSCELGWVLICLTHARWNVFLKSHQPTRPFIWVDVPVLHPSLSQTKKVLKHPSSVCGPNSYNAIFAKGTVTIPMHFDNAHLWQ